MGEVTEADGAAAQVLNATIDRFGGTVAGAGPVSAPYPPGVLTGVAVSIPASIVLFWWARRTALTTPRQLVAAIALAAIGTLALGDSR